MRLIADIALGLWASIRETLPGDEQEAQIFLSGMVYMFVLHWAFVLLVTWLYLKTVRAA